MPMYIYRETKWSHPGVRPFFTQKQKTAHFLLIQTRVAAHFRCREGAPFSTNVPLLPVLWLELPDPALFEFAQMWSHPGMRPLDFDSRTFRVRKINTAHAEFANSEFANIFSRNQHRALRVRELSNSAPRTPISRTRKVRDLSAVNSEFANFPSSRNSGLIRG